MNRFCRADVLRILHITAKQLVGWQTCRTWLHLRNLHLLRSPPDQKDTRPPRQARAPRRHPRVIASHAEAGRGHGESVARGQRLQCRLARGLSSRGPLGRADRRPVRHGLRSASWQLLRCLYSEVKPIAKPDSLQASCSPAASPWKSIPAPTTKPSKPTCGCWRSNPNTPPLTSTWAPCITTGRISPPPKNTTAQPSSPTRAMRSAYFDLGNVLDETGGSQTHCGLQNSDTAGSYLRRCPLQSGASLRALRNRARPFITGRPTSSSIAPAHGRCMPASRSRASWKATNLKLVYRRGSDV